jgi:hypothetical protein
MEIIKAVAEGKASPELVEINMTIANSLARSLKWTMSVPGLIADSHKV